MRNDSVTRATLLWILTATIISTSLPAAGAPVATNDVEVHALFDLDTPRGAPFPSDCFTVPAPGNLTGLRINLPKPDCTTYPSECEDLDVINTLDGFHVQPRLSIPFDGPLDLATVTSRNVFLINLDDPSGPVGINQIVWDTFTNTLHAQPDAALNQHARYILIATNGVRDTSGHPVGIADGFKRLRAEGARETTPYAAALAQALAHARATGLVHGAIVSASLFTTQSVTSTLEKISGQIKGATPPPAVFDVAGDGTRMLFALADLTSVTWQQQTGANPPRFTPSDFNLNVLRRIPGAIDSIAFGKYRAPDYLVHPGEYMPPTPTATGSPAVQSMTDIYFNLFLPGGTRPAGGWPVAMFLHGTGGSKNGRTTGANDGVLSVAATMAAHGLATLAINANGHGYGPLGTLTVRKRDGSVITIPSGGRGIDQDGDGVIGGADGNEATSPRTLQLNRDGLLQTIADHMQLIRVIGAGVDVNGDGTRDLNPSRIYFFGHSLGSMLGIDLMAVEPEIRAAVFTVPAGPLVENRRLGPSFRSSGTAIAASSPANLFAARRPSLINGPGVTVIDGVPVPPGPAFNENMPLRDGVPLTVRLADGTTAEIRSPVINTVEGAMDIQEWFDRASWAAQAANPVAWAPYLRRNPLPGMTARPVLFQFAVGDQAAPNPNNMTIVRAGDLADRTTFYRTDLARAENPALPKNPHGFMLSVSGTVPLMTAIAAGAQEQIATFFESDGAAVIQAEPARFYVMPSTLPSPEALNFIP